MDARPSPAAGPIDATASELHNCHSEVLFLDARTRLEYLLSHIPGALQLTRDQVLEQVPKSQTVAVVCLSGHRSVPVAKWLAAQGYQRVYNMKGGFWKWWWANYPTKSGSQP